MKISTKGRYAIRLLLELAQNDRNCLSLKEIAESQNVSKKYLEQIVPLLTNSGFLKANRGYRGGYILGKNPKDCKIGEILRVTEGNLAPISCLENSPVGCERSDVCLTLPLWQGLYRVICDYLDSITLQDLLDGKLKNTRN
ncbi:MAG: Rrf2 family transcriptional regulator [Clostridia bacterium]|nr:Rrf2 family transcriptional regulator [Clostridia bacterium]